MAEHMAQEEKDLRNGTEVLGSAFTTLPLQYPAMAPSGTARIA
jgi:hypothetical protein